MASKLNIEEIDRSYYGGPSDKKRRAINIHSSREYSCNGRKFIVDRNLSMFPPMFELLESTGQGILPVIEIDGERMFGAGISWNKALPIAFQAISNHLSSTVNDSAH